MVDRGLLYLLLNTTSQVLLGNWEKKHFSGHSPKTRKEYKEKLNKLTKIRHSIKAISPVIAVLLMIAIAVVASLVAYAWIMGYIGGTTSRAGTAIEIPSYATVKSDTEPAIDGKMVVYVQNVGQGSVQLDPNNAVYINDVPARVLRVDGNPVSGQITLTQGQTVALIVDQDYDGSSVTVKVVTTGGTSMQKTGKGGSGGTGQILTSTSLTSNVNPTTVEAGTPVTVSGKLTAGTTELSSRTISITYQQGTTVIVQSTVTDSSGDYTNTFTQTIEGTWTITARFAGDSTYAQSSAPPTTLTVTPATLPSTSIICTVTPSTITLGNTVTTSGTLTSGATGISGKTVTITYQSSGHADVLRTATTDSSGDYSNTYEPDTGGDWTATASFAGDTSYSGSTSSAQPFTVEEFDQVSVTFNYQISGGGSGYSAPTVQYVQSGVTKTITASPTATVLVDVGTSYSYTNNPLTGSSSNERWQTTTAAGTISTATTINPTYYHQYQITLSYSITGGTGSSSAPTYTANRFGASTPQTLTTSATGYWFDAGASWTATNPLGGSSSTERWQTAQTVTGTISTFATTAFSYQRQYYLTITSPVGTPTGQTTGWHNAGASITSTIAAFTNTFANPSKVDYTPNGWTGTGSAPTSGTGATVTFTLNSASSITWKWIGVLTLYPSGTGSSVLSRITSDGYSSNWQCVSDVDRPDSNNYVYRASSSSQTDLYLLPNSGITTGTINTVTAFIRAQRSGSSSGPTARTVLSLSGSTLSGASDVTLSSSWANYQTAYSGGLTWNDINNNLQAGVRLASGSTSNSARCTLVWVVVNFSV